MFLISVPRVRHAMSIVCVALVINVFLALDSFMLVPNVLWLSMKSASLQEF